MGIQSIDMIEYVEENMLEYGTDVICNRALPDFRDGLKPIHRRNLWTLYKQGLHYKGMYQKSAKVVGDCMGNYHPHGDAAIYDALCKMTNTPIALVNGRGNFGTLIDKTVGAQRYTEVKLTKYSDLTMLDPFYLSVIDTVPNYIGSEQEPLYLPALFPNLLLNGTNGIAVGVTADIPPIHIESLMPCIEKFMKGENISIKKFANTIRFNWKYGSSCITDPEDIAKWLSTGTGSLYFEPKYELDRDKRLLIITEAPPFFNWDNVVNNVLGIDKKGKANYPFVSSCDEFCSSNTGKKKKKKKTISEDKEEIRFEIKFKNTIDMDDFTDLAKKIVKEFTNYTRSATNITHRKTETDIDFHRESIPGILKRWTEYRVDLEKRAQEASIARLKIQIDHKDLLLLAVKNRKTVAHAWEVDNPKEYLSSKLSITKEQSEEILSYTIWSLTKMNTEKIIKDKEKLILEKKERTGYFNHPDKKTLSEMSNNLSLVT